MAERVYLDTSGLPHSLRINADGLPKIITIDGSDFLNKLTEIKDSFLNEFNSDSKDKLKELNEARATMMLNFGPSGVNVKGLINNSDDLSNMILKVLKHFLK